VTNTSTGGWTSRERVTVDRLAASTGRTVTVIDDGDVPAGGLSGYGLIVVSTNASTSTIDTKLYASTTPVLTWNANFYGRLKLASSTGDQSSQTRIAVIEPNHPAVAGVGTSPTVLTSSGSLPYGTPPSTALKLARIASSTTRWTIFAVRPGSKLTDGKGAAGCRIAFAAPSNWSTVAPAGWQLFDQTVAWALGGCS
jgi:hypothetical protein